jgi:hypothetical protein
MEFTEMSLPELRTIAKHHGVQTRLTKSKMIEALEQVPAIRRQAERDRRDALHAVPVTLYSPAGALEGRDRDSRRARNRFERRHAVSHVQPASKNPLRPAVIVLTTSKRTRDAEGERVSRTHEARFGKRGLLAPATREAMGDWR